MTSCAVGAVCAARVRERWRRTSLVGFATVVGADLTQVLAPGSSGLSVSGVVTFYGGLALTWSVVGGWLSRELEPDVAAHWTQLPISPLTLYGLRFGALTLSALGLAVLQVLVVAVSFCAIGATESALLLVAGLPGMAIVYLGFCVLVWVLGGWRVSGDGWAALLLGALLSLLELVARLRPGWLGPTARVADVIGAPLDDLGVATSLLSEQTAEGWVALGRVILWMAGWSVVGAVGVHVACRPMSAPVLGPRGFD